MVLGEEGEKYDTERVEPGMSCERLVLGIN